MVHTVHTNRDKRRRRGEWGSGKKGCEKQRGEEGGQDAVVVCFVMPKWGKAALTYTPPIFLKVNIKRKNQWNYWDAPLPPLTPHHKKTTTLWLSGAEERRRGRTSLALGGRDTEARGGSQSEWWRWGSHCVVVVLHLCVTGGRAKGWRGRGRAGGAEVWTKARQGEGGQGEERVGGEEEG